MSRLLIVGLLSFYCLNLFALTIKVGVVAPDGTTWANNIKKMVKEIKKATDKKVKFKVYYGGVQGDEPDVLRKIRVGQLHGGIFTGRALGEINGDIRVVEIPFTFGSDREKAWGTVKELEPMFNKGFSQNGFVNLGLFELGLIYLVSNKKIDTYEKLKGVKVWSWAGDELARAMVETMGLVSVPLALPDVLSSLSTGIIDSAYSSPLGVLALQWHTKIKYFIDYPITYAVGAFLVDQKQWNKISKEHQVIVSKIADKYIKKANEGTVKDNIEAVNVMSSQGIEVIKANDKLFDDMSRFRNDLVKKLKGKLFSDSAYQSLQKAIQ